MEKDGKVEDGDIAVINFAGFKDGVAFDGGTAENYSLTIGSNTFIPGFEDALIGAKTGDEKDVNVTFPEDYPSDELKGQPVVFKVKVHEVKTRVLPEINEDLFDDLGLEGVNSKEELEKHVEEEIKKRKEQNAENKLIDELLENILQVLYAIAIGFMLVMIFYKTKSMIVCIAMHSIFNSLSAVFYR